MDTIEFDRQVKSYLQSRPFQRFQIVFAEGDAITIAKPKELFTHAGGAVYFRSNGEMDLFHADEVAEVAVAKAKKKAKASR